MAFTDIVSSSLYASIFAAGLPVLRNAIRHRFRRQEWFRHLGETTTEVGQLRQNEVVMNMGNTLGHGLAAAMLWAGRLLGSRTLACHGCLIEVGYEIQDTWFLATKTGAYSNAPITIRSMLLAHHAAGIVGTFFIIQKDQTMRFTHLSHFILTSGFLLVAASAVQYRLGKRQRVVLYAATIAMWWWFRFTPAFLSEVQYFSQKLINFPKIVLLAVYGNAAANYGVLGMLIFRFLRTAARLLA